MNDPNIQGFQALLVGFGSFTPFGHAPIASVLPRPTCRVAAAAIEIDGNQMLLGAAGRLPGCSRPRRSSGFLKSLLPRLPLDLESCQTPAIYEDRRPSGASAGVARRPGHRAIAALVFIGIAAPPLGELLKPYVTEAVFLLLCVSFLRVDLGALCDQLRRPGLVLAATAWTTLAVPLISGGSWFATGLDTRSPDLYLALMLQAVASPMMASPALAAVMGLDLTLALVTLVTSTALISITAPLFAYAFFGAALTLSPLGLGLKLAAILCGIAAGRRRDPLQRGHVRHQAARPAHRWIEHFVSLWFLLRP